MTIILSKPRQLVRPASSATRSTPWSSALARAGGFITGRGHCAGAPGSSLKTEDDESEALSSDIAGHSWLPEPQPTTGWIVPQQRTSLTFIGGELHAPGEMTLHAGLARGRLAPDDLRTGGINGAGRSAGARGNDKVLRRVVYCAGLVDATCGVIFPQRRLPGMCGHGTIGLRLHHPAIAGVHKIDTPVGPVSSRVARADGAVTLRNAPAYRHHRQHVSAQVPDMASGLRDIALGR